MTWALLSNPARHTPMSPSCTGHSILDEDLIDQSPHTPSSTVPNSPRAMNDAIVNVKVKVNCHHPRIPAVQWLPGLLPKPRGWRAGWVGVRLLRSWTDQWLWVYSATSGPKEVEETRWYRDPWQPTHPKPILYGWKLYAAKKKYSAGVRVREANWNQRCCGHSMPEQWGLTWWGYHTGFILQSCPLPMYHGPFSMIDCKRLVDVSCCSGKIDVLAPARRLLRQHMRR